MFIAEGAGNGETLFQKLADWSFEVHPPEQRFACKAGCLCPRLDVV